MNIEPSRNDFAALAGRDGRPAKVKYRVVRVSLYALSLLLDTIAVIGGFTFASQFRAEKWLSAGDISLALLAVPLFLMFSIAREAQSVETLENRSLGMRRALGALLATAICLVLLTFVVQLEEISRLGFALAFAGAAVLLIVSRLILNVVFWRVLGGTATSKLLLIDGIKATAEESMDVIDVGREGLWPDVTRPEKLHALSTLVVNYDRVVVACTEDHRHAWSLFLRGSDVGGEILLENDVLKGAVAIGQCADQDTLVLSLGPLSMGNRIQKRAFDIAVTVPLIIALSPLLIAIAIAIRLESPGPALFRQVRVGEGNRQFRIFKFRSMRVEASDSSGERSTGRDDDRITRVGAFIRKTSIDELPQLFNVLRGEMSLVGPRPHALGSTAEDRLFWEVTEHYWLRHALKPGMTGLAQVRGLRGSTERKEDLTKRLRSDLEYVVNWSVANDILIMLKTFKVLVHRNAY